MTVLEKITWAMIALFIMYGVFWVKAVYVDAPIVAAAQ